MDVATALYASAAVLLVIAGVVKVMRPADTAALLDDLGAPSLGSLGTVQVTFALGIFEIGLGVSALVTNIAAIAVVVGAVYVVFSATVLRAMRLGAGSCGCFGRVDAPPSWSHVIGNLALAGCAFVASAGSSPLEVMEKQPLAGVGFVILVGVLAGLGLIVFTALPEALDARKPARGVRS
ncbi:MAG: MauE/DoxX family redox-associated membrane protein [Actinomycetota bacterium]